MTQFTTPAPPPVTSSGKANLGMPKAILSGKISIMYINLLPRVMEVRTK